MPLFVQNLLAQAALASVQGLRSGNRGWKGLAYTGVLDCSCAVRYLRMRFFRLGGECCISGIWIWIPTWVFGLMFYVMTLTMYMGRLRWEDYVGK